MNTDLTQTQRFAYYDSTEQTYTRKIPRDLIRAREILWGLVYREIKARYRYAILGFLWAIIEPIGFMLILLFVFSFVFRQKLGVADGDIKTPFATTILCGLIFWQYFSTSVSSATYSVIHQQNLVKKIYFPREVIPLASVIYPMLNLAIGFIALIVIHFLLGGRINFTILWVFIIFPILFSLTYGLGLIFSTGHIHFRDVGNMVNVGLVFGFYASPIFYPAEWVKRALENNNLPPMVYTLYNLNPMVGIISSLRKCILEGNTPDISQIIFTASLSFIILLIGTYVFRKNAPNFSDYL